MFPNQGCCCGVRALQQDLGQFNVHFAFTSLTNLAVR